MKNIFRQILGGVPQEPTRVGVMLTIGWAVLLYASLCYLFVFSGKGLHEWWLTQGVKFHFYIDALIFSLGFLSSHGYLFLIPPTLAMIYWFKIDFTSEMSKKQAVMILYRIKRCMVILFFLVVIWVWISLYGVAYHCLGGCSGYFQNGGRYDLM